MACLIARAEQSNAQFNEMYEWTTYLVHSESNNGNTVWIYSTNWLIRTATRVSFGPTAKKALIGYARSKPHLAKYAQVSPTPTDCADPAPSLNFASTV
ncbi:unnamed protein product [Toxocara canis]|uniref:DUF3291 domain-containing protein n=1 Tax=Toxocara canis TaxID=6265 RepID=A0A183VBK4_TOXCA|nr:unnamed protein product [Toxocara canis]